MVTFNKYIVLVYTMKNCSLLDTIENKALGFVCVHIVSRARPGVGRNSVEKGQYDVDSGTIRPV